MRIAKYLASCGLGARRKSEEFVTAGKVRVNDEVVKDLSMQIKPTDKVYVDDKLCQPKDKVYYLLNKPTGVTSTLSDKHAQKVITNLVPKEPPVWPVGRLDRETGGLIILTNDGELTQKLTHPSYQKEKEYIAKLDSDLKEEDILSIKQGISLEDGPIKPNYFEYLGDRTYKIVIHEGRKRLVRRTFSHFGKDVVSLTRVRIGQLELDGLKTGEYRNLTPEEIRGLDA